MDTEAYFDRLWPICRSITGNGFRESLNILSEVVPFEVHEVPSGKEVFDWVVPDEWNITEAYIEDEEGNRLIDMADNNLHVVSYSLPVDDWFSFEALEPRLHVHASLPNAIPYQTSYYKPYWGFCLSQEQKSALFSAGKRYHVVIRSTLEPGSLTYGLCVLPATVETSAEILVTSYLCHPSMANNELSGPLTLMNVYDRLSQLEERRFNYRFFIGPETIGTITFLHEWGNHLKEHCVGGMVLSCCGYGKTIHYRQTWSDEHLMDRCVRNYENQFNRAALESDKEKCHVKSLPFTPTGSDNRFYASPGFRIPVGSVVRNLYGVYPEYHTSLDNKSVIDFDDLHESADFVCEIFSEMEANAVYKTLFPFCEPQLGKRNLYYEPCTQKTGPVTSFNHVNALLHLLYYGDGDFELVDIAQKMGISVKDLANLAKTLEEQEVLTSTKRLYK